MRFARLLFAAGERKVPARGVQRTPRHTFINNKVAKISKTDVFRDFSYLYNYKVLPFYITFPIVIVVASISEYIPFSLPFSS